MNRLLGEMRRLPSPLEWLCTAVLAIIVGMVVLLLPHLETRLVLLISAVAIMLFVSILTGGVRQWMCAAIALDIPLQMGVYYGFDDAMAARGAITGYNISVSTLALFVLYGEWIIELALKRSQSQLNPRQWITTIAPPTLYLIVALVSVTYAQDPQRSVYELFTLLQIFLLFIYVTHRIKTRKEVFLFVTALLIGLAIEGLIMIYLRGTGHEFKLGVIAGRIDVDKGSIGMRIGGTVGSPISAASYLALLIGLAASIWFMPVALRYKLMSGSVLVLAALGLIFTLSRGGWTTAALSITLLSMAALYRKWVSPAVIVGIVVLLIAVVFAFQDTIMARLTGDDVGSTAARLPLMNLAWKIIRDYPIQGVGLNNFAAAMPPYLTPEFNGAWIYTVHNKYMLVWAETGIFGLLTFLAFLAVTLRNGWKVFNLNDPMLAPLGIGMTASVASQLSHMTLDVFHSRPQVELLWLVAALINVLLRLSQVQQPQHTDQTLLVSSEAKSR